MGKKEERGAESCWWAAEGPDWGSTSSSRGSPLRPLLLLLLRLLLRGLPGEARVRPGGRGLRDKGEGKAAGMRPSRPHTSVVTVDPAVGGRLPRHRTLVPASRRQLSRASWLDCSSQVTGKDCSLIPRLLPYVMVAARIPPGWVTRQPGLRRALCSVQEPACCRLSSSPSPPLLCCTLSSAQAPIMAALRESANRLPQIPPPSNHIQITPPSSQRI